MKDSNSYTLHPCFGHARSEPETCSHPITAQFSTHYIDYRLMCGTKVAPDQTLQPAQVTWPPPDKPKKNEYWHRAANCYQVRCFACGTVLNDFAHTWCDTGKLVKK